MSLYFSVRPLHLAKDTVVQELATAGRPAVAVHGGRPQAERLGNLGAFAAAGGPQVLVATDVLGRGIDLPQVCRGVFK